MKITIMFYTRELEDMTFEEVIKKNLRPKKKLVMVERMKFLSKIHEQNETILQYIYWLKQASRFCLLEKLRTKEMTIEEEQVQLRLIKGLDDWAKKNKILEQLQTWDISLDLCRIFAAELIDQFNTTQENAFVFQVNMSKEKEAFDISKYSNKRHERNRNKGSAFGQVCRSFTIFQVSASSKISLPQ